MREMSIDSIRVSLSTYQRVVVLKVKDSDDRYLPIWIGATEADAIALKLQDVSTPRPLTHDLIEAIITSLGAEVAHILVSDLSDDTFYAKIVLQHDGGQTEIDARPSDAIALAVRADAPIFADDSVIDKAALRMDDDSSAKQGSEDGGEEGGAAVEEEELVGLSAFTDFIDSLDLEDLGEGQNPAGSTP